MRTAACLLVLLAGSANSQWRTFDGRPAAVVTSESWRAMLDAHNAVRTQTGVPALSWSAALARRAQDWANTLLSRGQFRHRPDTPYGENLFEISGDTASPGAVVRTWASQASNYDYRTNSCRGVCGHYKQVIWSDTKEVGCGVARGRGREVWVCNYDPPGNVAGARPY